VLGRLPEAIEIYQKLIRRGVESMAYGDCGEGLAWARGLICDCHYRLAHCHKHQNKNREAIRAFKKALSLRGHGCRSIYPIKEMRSELKALENANNLIQPTRTARR
jgi:hypothetical protein